MLGIYRVATELVAPRWVRISIDLVNNIFKYCQSNVTCDLATMRARAGHYMASMARPDWCDWLNYGDNGNGNTPLV
jgi:hypothetical protein